MQLKTGSGNKGLDWVMIMGMIAAFPKTADLLSFWTPRWLNDLFGMDMSWYYGAFCAAMVEGTILFLHFDRRAHGVTSAQAVKWILIGVSFVCQIFDSQVTANTLSQMPDTMKVALTYIIPALPLIIAVMVASIGALPEVDDSVAAIRHPHVGWKTRLDNFWYGDRENTRVSVKIGEPKFVPDEPKPEPSGNGSNPTNRQS